jgi:hypothetical protein
LLTGIQPLNIILSVAWIALGAGLLWFSGADHNPYALAAGIAIQINGLLFLYSDASGHSYQAGVKDGHAQKNYKPDLSDD